MDKVTQYTRSVWSLTYFVLGWLKKLMFWRRTGYRDQESLLPVTMTSANKSAQFNYSSSSIVNSYNTNINSNWNLINNRHPTNNTESQEQDAEPDYFSDLGLAPTMTKQKKVRSGLILGHQTFSSFSAPPNIAAFPHSFF